MTALLDRQLLVVTGKGGTGKTTVSAGLAQLAARSGKRVLVCDTDATGDLGAPFGVDSYGYEPTEVEPNLFLMQMDTEKALREYLELNLNLPFVAKVASLAKAFDFIATAAPGVREILVMGKLAWDVKREKYDIVIVDASATGHIVSQLSSADSIGDLVSTGPLVRQTDWMKEMLSDGEKTGLVIVTLPEELPVSETIELSDKLHEKTRVSLTAVVVNRVLPELFTRDESVLFDELDADALQQLVPGDTDPILDAARLARSLRRTQVTHLETLQQGIDVPMIFVPQSFGDVYAKSVTDDVHDALAAELE